MGGGEHAEAAGEEVHVEEGYLSPVVEGGGQFEC